MQAAAVEFDDRPGPVRDAVIEHFAGLERDLGRAVDSAAAQGHLRPDLDRGQFVFDMLGVIFAYYHAARLFAVTGRSASPSCVRAAHQPGAPAA